MDVVLATWDAMVRAEVAKPDRLIRAAAVAKSVLRAGASEASIVAAEQRLGCRLPPSYREFLALSDGAFAGPDGAVTAELAKRLSPCSVPGSGLLPVADLSLLTDAAPDIVATWTEDLEPPYSPLAHDGAAVVDLWPLLSGDAVLISTRFESALTALVPVGDDPEWQLWQFSRDEVTGFRSFRSWLAHATFQPGRELVMDLIRLCRDRDPARGSAIRKVRDPAALPILLAALDEFSDDEWVVAGLLAALGGIRNEIAIPAIESRLTDTGYTRNAAIDALRRIGTPAARDALFRRNVHWILHQLNDPRAGEAAVRELGDGRDGLFGVATLGALADAQYVPVLLKALRNNSDDRPSRRFVIIAAIYRCAPEIGRPYLEAVVTDPEHLERDRQRAAAILAE